MNMRAIRFLNLALICIFISPVCGHAEEVPDSNSLAPFIAYVGPLKLKLVAEQFMGQNMLEAVLENPSNDFYCFDARALDSTYQEIRLKSKSGKEVPLSTYGEMRPDAVLGFDYNVPYLIILPNEIRKMDANIKNFKISPGEYTYKVVFSYYLCRDAIDTSRIQKQLAIKRFINQATGSISLEREKQFHSTKDKSKARKTDEK